MGFRPPYKRTSDQESTATPSCVKVGRMSICDGKRFRNRNDRRHTWIRAVPFLKGCQLFIWIGKYHLIRTIEDGKQLSRRVRGRVGRQNANLHSGGCDWLRQRGDVICVLVLCRNWSFSPTAYYCTYLTYDCARHSNFLSLYYRLGWVTCFMMNEKRRKKLLLSGGKTALHSR